MSPPLLCGIPAVSAGCVLGTGALGLLAGRGAGAAGALCGVVGRADGLELLPDLTISRGGTRAVVVCVGAGAGALELVEGRGAELRLVAAEDAARFCWCPATALAAFVGAVGVLGLLAADELEV